MPRRLTPALATAVLLLQLALGLLDSACAASMALAPTPTAAHVMDMAACDAPAPPTVPGLREDRAPAHERSAPDCHALAACGASFVAAASWTATAGARTFVRVASVVADAPSSVPAAPEPPPPRA